MKKQTIGLVLVLASGYPALSQALSLGEIQFNSRLNEPFKARIELLHATPQELDKLQVHVAPPSIFAQAHLQRPAFIDGLQFARSVKNGRHYLIISSSQTVAEAEFNLLLEVTSPKGDLLKRYSVALAEKPSAVRAATTPNPAQDKSTQLEVAAASQEAEPTLDLGNPTSPEGTPQAVGGAVLKPVSQIETASSSSLNLAVDTEQLNSAESRTMGEAEVVAAAPVESTPATTIPVSLPIERSARVRPTTPKVAIPLPKLAFKYRYRVRKNDTVFTIAERLKVGRLNLDEKVLALYARNPKAFVNGDITQLKVGATLRTPSAVGKKRVADPIPAATQLVRRAAPIERPEKVQAAKPVVQPKVAVQQVVATELASAPALIDPPLARAVHELELSSQLKLTDLQERLSQTQQLLETRAQENNQLKELVQEKNRLLTRREEELATLQTQVAQQAPQVRALAAMGAAGPEGKTDELVAATSSQASVAVENTWQGVFASPLVWQAGGASALFLLLIGIWQKRRNADKLMQLHVQNTILMPDAYIDEDDSEEGSLLNFLWAEEELERAREQLQSLRHSMASLREQSQRLQAYLQPEPLSASV